MHNFKVLALLCVSVIVSGCQTVAVSDFKLDGQVSANVYQASETPAPTILVSHGSDCVTDHYLGWANLLSSNGFNAVIVNHCHEKGLVRHTGKVKVETAPEARVKDLMTTANWVLSQPWHDGKVGVIGFSQGGSGVNLLGNTTMMQRFKIVSDVRELSHFGAFVSYYPGCGIPGGTTPDLPYAPFLMHLAELDGLSEIQWCQTGFRKNENLTIHIYKGVHHAFDVVGMNASGQVGPYRRHYRSLYDPNADKLSRQRTLDFFNAKLK